jgi:hypothetical protein
MPVRGMSAYLEGLVSRISAPSLSTFRVYLFNLFSFTSPRLLQFTQTSESLTFSTVQITFGALAVSVPWKWDSSLLLHIKYKHLDRQVASAVQFFGTLSPILSVV